MSILIHPTYFGSIAHFVTITQASSVVFEVMDHYQKQTHRNRTYIYAANGVLTLNIPVVYTHKKRQPYGDVRIFNAEDWQKNHWKSLCSAYKRSPFFEFYEDTLAPLFCQKFEYLAEFNLHCFETICDCLDIVINYSKTTSYEKHPATSQDFRQLTNAKKPSEQPFDQYTQVFSNKHDFIPNLSILDLLFNEGPNAPSYLESQHLKIPEY